MTRKKNALLELFPCASVAYEMFLLMAPRKQVPFASIVNS